MFEPENLSKRTIEVASRYLRRYHPKKWNKLRFSEDNYDIVCTAMDCYNGSRRLKK